VAAFHTQVHLSGYSFPDSQLTFKLKSGITTSDVGKAVSLDTSAANTVKLAGDGDVIIGRLETVEDRTNEGTLLGTVALRFAAKLTIKSGLSGAAVVAVGSRVKGAGSGEIKAVDGSTDLGAPAYPLVVEVSGSTAWVLKV
jgi:hypothetical protein